MATYPRPSKTSMLQCKTAFLVGQRHLLKFIPHLSIRERSAGFRKLGMDSVRTRWRSRWPRENQFCVHKDYIEGGMSVFLRSRPGRVSPLAVAAALMFGTVPATGLAAGGGGGGSAGFAELFSEAAGTGSCSVNRISAGANTFYVPSGGGGSYNVLGWGNGTGGTSLTYRGLLERMASHCIFVAAANTSNAGDGTEIRDAVNAARSSFGQISSNPVVCTSGHSQGGGGSFNAASLLGADCIISVQADTVFTTRITRTLPADTDVIALWSENDSLAPRSTNSGNTFGAARDTYVSIETDGESHFAPASGSGGDVGTVQRLAAIALLAPSSSTRQRFRQALYGDETDFTVTESNGNISYVFRNSAAVNENP